MSENINYVNDSNFKAEVLESEELVVVDFYADWCMPCKMLAPILEDLANSNIGKAKVTKLDVDSSKVIAATYKIMGVPSVLFFKGGQEVYRIVGVKGKEDFQAIIEKLVS